MTMTPPPPSHGREPAISLAIRLGLLWQAAFSVAMLLHYVRHGSSFYLPDIAGAWPYVHQHVLWIGAFVALGMGSRRLARALSGGAALLAVVQIVSLAAGGASTSEVLAAAGVACFGLLPAIALLLPGVASAFHRRLDWLASGIIAATVVALFDDGIAELASGGMRIGLSESNGVVRAVWVGWVACILALAWQGRSDRPSRLAAIVSTGHLAVAELVWLASDTVAQLDGPELPGRTRVPLDSVTHVLVLAAVFAAALLLTRSGAPSSTESTPRQTSSYRGSENRLGPGLRQ